jgi:hypothetical protein
MVVDPGGGNVLTVESVSGLDEIDRQLERGRAGGGPPERESPDDDTDAADGSEIGDREFERDAA